MTLTVALVSCLPGTIGVPVSAAEAAEACGTGVSPPSEILVIAPSDRPAAFASASARDLAFATAAASAWRKTRSASLRLSSGPETSFAPAAVAASTRSPARAMPIVALTVFDAE